MLKLSENSKVFNQVSVNNPFGGHHGVIHSMTFVTPEGTDSQILMTTLFSNEKRIILSFSIQDDQLYLINNLISLEGSAEQYHISNDSGVISSISGEGDI